MNVLKVIKQILIQKNYFIIFVFATLLSFFTFYKLTLATVTDKSLEIFIMMSGWNFTYFNFTGL